MGLRFNHSQIRFHTVVQMLEEFTIAGRQAVTRNNNTIEGTWSGFCLQFGHTDTALALAQHGVEGY